MLAELQSEGACLVRRDVDRSMGGGSTAVDWRSGSGSGTGTAFVKVWSDGQGEKRNYQGARRSVLSVRPQMRERGTGSSCDIRQC